MSKRVGWTASAKDELRALPQIIAIRILRALGDYVSRGEGDVKSLQNIHPPQLRLRIGDYRVRFHDRGDSIEVLAVRHRREAYR
jgi:mRNA-degrading endonuclease RelE of RelBE toxin-antitoxin system